MAFATPYVSGIDDNRTIKSELTAALAARRGARFLSVTDLMNPRRAHFQRAGEETARSPGVGAPPMADPGFRDLFGGEVPTDHFVEQFVTFQGVVGKIDVYQEAPTDLRTTGVMPDDLPTERGSYVDQLGLYCAMIGAPRGRLVVYRRAGGGRPPAIKVFDARYRDLRAIEHELTRRRDLLHGALDAADPGPLPRCEGVGGGCEYRGTCGCDGAPLPGRLVPPDAVRLKEDEELARALGAHAARHALGTAGAPRICDLVPVSEGDGAGIDDEANASAIEWRLAELDRQGFWGALNEALYFGIPGAFTRQYVELRSLAGWVPLYKDVPTLLRATDARELVARRDLTARFGPAIDQLAFSCALAQRDRGRLVLYYRGVAGDAFMVHDVWFTSLGTIRAEASGRIKRLSRSP